jgi:8-oxo-dGTP diphosphatase
MNLLRLSIFVIIATIIAISAFYKFKERSMNHFTETKSKFFVGVGAIFIKNGEVLTVFRTKTEKNSQKHGLIGGLVKAGESLRQAAMREIFEEIGVTVKPENLRLIHTMSVRENCEETVGHYFLIDSWDGEPFNKATDKHDYIEWIDLDQLPDTLIPRNRQAIENMFEEISYSEYGF